MDQQMGGWRPETGSSDILAFPPRCTTGTYEPLLDLYHDPAAFCDALLTALDCQPTLDVEGYLHARDDAEQEADALSDDPDCEVGEIVLDCSARPCLLLYEDALASPCGEQVDEQVVRDLGDGRGLVLRPLWEGEPHEDGFLEATLPLRLEQAEARWLDARQADDPDFAR